MKTYSDFMNEINETELYEGLLGYGLFSEKIPPVFCSKMFFDYCQTNNPLFEDKWQSYVRYDSMRNTNVIRELGIPTPMSYQKLCYCIKTNWSQIKKHFNNCTDKHLHIISRLHIRKMKSSPTLFQMNYNNWKDDGSPELDLLIGSKYIVHADISKCFPSIYSHSLPWAIAGKTFSKTRDGRNKDLWQNQLDHYIQNCKYGETHGLLIGPHTSNLISEIILANVDKELYSNEWKYTRHIDDYTCYVESVEKANLFILELNQELRKFDLMLNDKKTVIEELPTALTKQWKRQIENVNAYYRNGKFDYISARSYFDNAIEIMQQNKENTAILNYAIKALPIEDMSYQAKIMCVKTIFHLCLLYPYLVHIMDEYVFECFDVEKGEIVKFTNQLYTQEKKHKNYDAVCYSLYFSMKYDFMIDDLTSEDSINSDSCIYKLFSYLIFKKVKNSTERAKLRTHATELKKNNEDLEKNWLFVYEVLPQSDLPSDWKKLKQNSISFLRQEFQIK